MHIAVRCAVTLQCDLGLRPQHGDRRAKLVGSVGHEALHLRHAPLDRRRRLTHQQPAANRHHDERKGRRGSKCRNQGGITILKFDLVRDRHGNQRTAVGQLKWFGMQLQHAVPSLAMLQVNRWHGPQTCGRGAHPIRRDCRRDRRRTGIEKEERSIRHMQLFHSVHDLATHAGFEFTGLGRAVRAGQSRREATGPARGRTGDPMATKRPAPRRTTITQSVRKYHSVSFSRSGRSDVDAAGTRYTPRR